MTATTVAASRPQSNKQSLWRRFVKGRGLSYCVLAVIGVFWIFPFLWMALGIAIRHTWNVAKCTPIIVTENGIATADDRRRIDYTFDAIAGMHDAMDDGIDVRGYLHWSLLDNYEWGSFAPTFGLASWDRDTFERHPKPSLDWLGSIARKGVMAR